MHDVGCDSLPGRDPVAEADDATGPGARRPALVTFTVMRRIARASFLSLIMVGLPSNAAAHDGDGRAEVLPAQVAPGGSVTVAGIGLSAGSEVHIGLVTGSGILDLGTAMADGAGDLRAEIVMPADLPSRYYELHATDNTGFELTGYVEVFDPTANDDPARGAEQGWPAWAPWALGALLAVVVVFAASRRRRVRATRAGG